MTQNPRFPPGAGQPDPSQRHAEQPDPEQPDPARRCPCGSGENYAGCCARFHQGAPTPTAEALMRSRYSANALLGEDPAFFATYLHRTWAAETRPALRDLTAPGPVWRGLHIVDTTAGGPFHDIGTVEFVASYQDDAGPETRGAGAAPVRGRLHELSRFRRESGRWLYVDGDVS
ncbi:YchJ family protein [Nesterenkonia jeotgali]|uniref:SEC-C motif-containing protein n=1 Tax=Nesterenkonia jeotgali TaxID=317018 RepID=A0A839FX77_9MICC|nr:YchJ family metal-binding protein [Nesterenkonia jeotgali]MBA8921644.1 SEC-C motif-containing protein [Nesterenkonia jeotgali]